MKTAKILVYGNIALYVYKMDYTLRCLDTFVQYLHH